MARFSNPTDVHAPIGAYSHTAVVPPGSELVFVSGQVGNPAFLLEVEAVAVKAQ